ncbi:MAG TPA: hypothetical protein VIO32_08395 [Candidatus Baltobacteraceae bacterium]
MIIAEVIVPVLLLTAVDCVFYYNVRVRQARRVPISMFLTIGAASYILPFLFVIGHQIVSPQNVLRYRDSAAVLAMVLAGYALASALYYALAFVLTESLLKCNPCKPSLVVASSMTIFFVLQIPLAVATMIGIPLLLSGRLP